MFLTLLSTLALSSAVSALVTLAPRSPTTPCAFACPPSPYAEVVWEGSLRVPADHLLHCAYNTASDSQPLEPFRCFYKTTNGLLVRDESAEDCPAEAAHETTPTYGCPAEDAWARPLQFAARDAKAADVVSCTYTADAVCNYSMSAGGPVDRNAGGPCPMRAVARCEVDSFTTGSEFVYHGQDAQAALQRKFLAGVEQQRVLELRRRGLVLD